ncbi:MAG TPA: macro domain-containing protein [Thermoleophilia bacterium]|nr:macro domain-containing protein [Thermoleophilia bacterium]
MKTSVGKTKLEIASGDITRLEVDTIVAPAGTKLWMDHGVAAALKRAGGDGIEKEAVLQGPVKVGEAVVTTGHGLAARWVVHTAVSESYPAVDADAGGIAAATRASLAAAERAHSRSVALPAFGTGAGAFPLYQCASLMVGETVAYLKEHPGTTLRHIMFAVYDDAARAAFKNAMAGISRF